MDLLPPHHKTPQTHVPKLYSSGQVIAAAALGSVLAGGWLLSRNLKNVGKESFAVNTLIVSFGLMVLIALLAMYVPSDFPNSPFGAGVGAVFYFWYRHSFSELYTSHIESGGMKESSWRVVGVAAISLPIAVIILIATMIIVPITSMNYVTVGENYIYYEGNATRQDADRLAVFLTDQGVFYDVSGWEFGIDFPKSQPNNVILEAPMEKPGEVSETYLAIRQLVDDAESELFPGRQVIFHVLNEYGFSVMRIDND